MGCELTPILRWQDDSYMMMQEPSLRVCSADYSCGEPHERERYTCARPARPWSRRVCFFYFIVPVMEIMIVATGITQRTTTPFLL